MDVVEEKIVFQVFVTVKENGELSSCEVGEPVVRRDPADFFFIIEDEAKAQDLKENAQNYKVVLNGMKPDLVLISQPEEGTAPETASN